MLNIRSIHFLSLNATVLLCFLPKSGFAESPAPMSKKNSKKVSNTNLTEEKLYGTDVSSSDESSAKTTPKIEDISRRLSEISALSMDTRSRILQLQSDAASRFQDVGNWELSLKLKSPLKTETATKSLPLSVEELSVDLNGFPILMQHSPIRTERDQEISIYSGPIPIGDYEVKLSARVGLVPWEWPAVVATGRWLVEKSIHISIKASALNATTKSEVLLSSDEGNKTLLFSLNGEVLK
jgi:hypothetical protein